MSDDKTKQVIPKKRNIFIFGILLVWLASLYYLFNFLSTIDSGTEILNKTSFFCVLIGALGIILMAKGSGFWFSDQGAYARIALSLVGVLLILALSYFLVEFTTLFPLWTIVYIALIIKSRKWPK